MATDRRVAAAGLGALIAVLAGLVVGAIGPTRDCVRTFEVPVRVADQEQPQQGKPREVRGTPELVNESEGCTGSFSPGWAALGFGTAVLVGGVVLAVLAVPRRRTGSVPGGAPGWPSTATGAAQAPRPPAPVAGQSRGRLDRAEADRARLVQVCIYTRDRCTSAALVERLGQTLEEVGVVTMAPDGQPFDPTRHEAGGSQVAPEPGAAGTIAAVEVPGYSDRGTVLRAPVVTVYRAAGR